VDDTYTYIVESDGSVPPLFPAFTWIAYQRPYGVVALVHPDGSDRH